LSNTPGALEAVERPPEGFGTIIKVDAVDKSQDLQDNVKTASQILENPFSNQDTNKDTNTLQVDGTTPKSNIKVKNNQFQDFILFIKLLILELKILLLPTLDVALERAISRRGTLDKG